MFKKFISTAALAATLGVMSGAAVAATLTPTGADCDALFGSTTLPSGDNTCYINDNRDDVANIEFNESPVGAFYSLGLGGGVTFAVNPAATGAGVVFEVTNPSRHDEALQVYVSNTGAAGDWVAVGPRIINNSGAPATTSHSFSLPGGSYSHIGFLDVTALEFGTASRSTDGFDIAAITLNTVPLPASALMLLAGVAGLGAVRARRKS